jgi:hypothetical protein
LASGSSINDWSAGSFGIGPAQPRLIIAKSTSIYFIYPPLAPTHIEFALIRKERLSESTAACIWAFVSTEAITIYAPDSTPGGA